jgi:toxin ParE1/3/4
MARKRIEIHPAALEELKSAAEWYLQRSEPAAEEFVAEVDRAVALVVESPRRWPIGEDNTRRYVLQRFPFAITYREKNSGVRVPQVSRFSRPGKVQPSSQAKQKPQVR